MKGIVINANLNIMNNLKQNIIFIDPPWGGPNYKKESNIVKSTESKFTRSYLKSKNM